MFKARNDNCQQSYAKQQVLEKNARIQQNILCKYNSRETMNNMTTTRTSLFVGDLVTVNKCSSSQQYVCLLTMLASLGGTYSHRLFLYLGFVRYTFSLNKGTSLQYFDVSWCQNQYCAIASKTHVYKASSFSLSYVAMFSHFSSNPSKNTITMLVFRTSNTKHLIGCYLLKDI